MAQAQTEVENNRVQANGLQLVQHPSDLGPFFISLDFYDYRAAFGSSKSEHNPENDIDPVRRLFNADRTSVNNQINKKTSFAKIKLPIPGNLSDNFKTAWEDVELGGFAGIASDIYQAAGQVFGGDGNLDADQAASVLQTAAKGTIKSVGRQLLNETTIGNIFDLATGTALNQNLTVLFRGPTLKTHQFKWRLAPKSAQESANIKKIIAIVKRAQHASRFTSESTSVLRYPSECLLQFVSANASQKDFLYPMRPCVLDSFDVNYAPNGSFSVHQGTYDPTVIELTMVFKETSYYTRESFDNANEYGYDGYNTSELTTGGEGIQYGGGEAPAANPPVSPPTPSEQERQRERVIPPQPTVKGNGF